MVFHPARAHAVNGIRFPFNNNFICFPLFFAVCYCCRDVCCSRGSRCLPCTRHCSLWQFDPILCTVHIVDVCSVNVQSEYVDIHLLRNQSGSEVSIQKKGNLLVSTGARTIYTPIMGNGSSTWMSHHTIWSFWMRNMSIGSYIVVRW